MIKLKITDSPDYFALEEFEFDKNIINIGKKDSDINIHDPDLLNHHIALEVLENKKLIVIPGKKIKNFLVNDKITTSQATVIAGQTIKIANTSFTIVSFDFDSIVDIKQLRDEKLQLISESELEKWDLLQKIQGHLD